MRIYINESVRHIVYNSSATNHSPTLASLDIAKKEASKYAQYKLEGNMKNLDQAKFNNYLVAQHWEELGLTDNLDDMSEIFMEKIRESFDKHALNKKIKVHMNHVKGLSDGAKS